MPICASVKSINLTKQAGQLCCRDVSLVMGRLHSAKRDPGGDDSYFYCLECGYTDVRAVVKDFRSHCTD